VAVVRGANAPAIMRIINEQLDQEHKVLKGEAQRKPVNIFILNEIFKLIKQPFTKKNK
jgi:hypothetical protein